MTTKEHTELYEELRKVIDVRGYPMHNLTEAQRYFIEALEQAAFGADLLKVYADLIEKSPKISLRSLHAFCIGFGLGLSDYTVELNASSTYH